MRSRRRSPKGGVLVEKQRRYVQLIEQGIDNAQGSGSSGSTARRGTDGGTADRSGIPPGSACTIRR